MLSQVPGPVAAQAPRVVHPLNAVGQELLQAAPTSAVFLQESSAQLAMWALVRMFRSCSRPLHWQGFCRDAEHFPRPRRAKISLRP